MRPTTSIAARTWTSFSIEWTFPDGTKAYDVGALLPKCYTEFDTFIHGTRCAAQFSGNIHAGTVQIYKDQRHRVHDNISLAGRPRRLAIRWQAEWNVLLEAIRNDRPHNEAQRGGAVEPGRHDGPGGRTLG